MNRVLSGEYDGCKVGLDGPRKCLYIKTDAGNVLLVKGSVAQYVLKQVLTLSGDRIYAIKWNDGATSVIRIEKPNETFLITSCETDPPSDAEIQKRKRGNVVCFILFLTPIIIGLVVGYNILNSPKQGGLASYNSQQITSRTWAEWNGDINSIDSAADAMVYVDPGFVGYKDENDLYYIMGKLYNNSSIAFTSAKLYFDIYDTDGNKVDTCLAGLSFSLRLEGVWNYRAVCGIPWVEGYTYKITDFTAK